MGVREVTLELLQQGNTPGQIAKKMGVNINTTLGYLDQLLGQGRVRRSDILLSIPAHVRKKPSDPYDRLVVSKYGSAAQLQGDIYEDMHFIETTLHKHIRSVMKNFYGKRETEWWRKGIPEAVRKQCQIRREEDEDPVEPYGYTDLIDLRTIIDKQWGILKETFPKELSSNKKHFLDKLTRLNGIRRMVMHPVRGSVPTEENFDFLRMLRHQLNDLLGSA